MLILSIYFVTFTEKYLVHFSLNTYFFQINFLPSVRGLITWKGKEGPFLNK